MGCHHRAAALRLEGAQHDGAEKDEQRRVEGRKGSDGMSWKAAKLSSGGRE